MFVSAIKHIRFARASNNYRINSGPFRLPMSSQATQSPTIGDSIEPRNATVESSIRAKLVAAFNPTSLRITNDSWKHSSHAAMREIGGGNGETHFAVDIVSDTFQGKTTLQRHRLVYAVLDEELKNSLHALQLNIKTPSQIAGPLA